MNSFGHIYILCWLRVFSFALPPNLNWVLILHYVSVSHMSHEPHKRWAREYPCTACWGPATSPFPGLSSLGVCWEFAVSTVHEDGLFTWKKISRWILITREPGSKTHSPLLISFQVKPGGWNPHLTLFCFPAPRSSWGADEKRVGLGHLVRSDF